MAYTGGSIESAENWAFDAGSVDFIEFFDTGALISVPDLIGWALVGGVLDRR